MPKNVKLNRRSVGTQSNLEVRGHESSHSRRGITKRHFEINSKFSSLCKKSAYRNLLQKSITIDAHGKVNLALSFQRSGGRSRGTQTILESEDDGKRAELSRDGSLDFAIAMHGGSPEVSLSPSLFSVESFQIADEPPTARVQQVDLPGTSRFFTAVNHSDSVSIQLEDREDSVEGSLAVVSSCDTSESFGSGLSTVGYVLDNEPGLGRHSNEAVILVQDYQSYDVLNAARRQDSVGPSFQHRRKFRYRKRKRGRRVGSTRPIPIVADASGMSSMVCRICHEGEDVEPLIRPCLCKGSVGHIHATCLKVWLEQSNTSRCEICGYPYAIRQTRRYTKCVSVTVFLRSIVDRRALMYDLISFVAVTPLCIAGIAMCIRASVISASGTAPGANFQLGNVTRAGMIMLSSTIIIAYSVWLYTLISYHYKSWKRWYNSCYDVEVIPVIMTSEERLEALHKFQEESRRRSSRAEPRGSIVAVLPPNPSYHPFQSSFQRRVHMSGRVNGLPQ